MSSTRSIDPVTTADRIIKTRDLEVTFDMNRGTSCVLNGVDLDVNREEILGIVGESGSGKSMLAHALLDAVVSPGTVRGEITYYPEDGDPVDVLSLTNEELKRFRWETISMVFQGAMSSFNPTMTIGDHFRETLEAHDYHMRDGVERARELISELYMDPERVLNAYPHELSGGMKQRALIALSLILEPEVLVMDEPTAALDLLMQRSILSLLKHVQDLYDLTILFITHDFPLIANLADRLLVMYAFDFVEMGSSDDLIINAAHPYTRALLKSTPNLKAPVEEMRPIGGASPDPVNVPSGCPYHPRCALADEQCQASHPGMRTIDGDHVAACYHWEDAADAIPLDINREPRQ